MGWILVVIVLWGSMAVVDHQGLYETREACTAAAHEAMASEIWPAGESWDTRYAQADCLPLGAKMMRVPPEAYPTTR